LSFEVFSNVFKKITNANISPRAGRRFIRVAGMEKLQKAIAFELDAELFFDAKCQIEQVDSQFYACLRR